MTKMNAILRWIVAPVIATACFFLAPKVDSTHLPSELGTFFATGATLLGTFFIALALLTAASPLAGYRIRQIVGYASFIYIAVGAAAAVGGTIVSWPYAAYPYFFAITAGSGSAVLVAVTRVGIANLKTQKADDIKRLAQALGQSDDQSPADG
jgi:hypothetical protein